LGSLLLWRTGGMPSSHSALVLSVSTTIGFRSGFTSDIFILAVCFALVVIRDALGVRRASGIQAKAINEIGSKLTENQLISFKSIKEVQGHKPLEVIVGCFLGFFIGLAFSIL
jgi:acid phosphatase family membrane protein YuiD